MLRHPRAAPPRGRTGTAAALAGQAVVDAAGSIGRRLAVVSRRRRWLALLLLLALLVLYLLASLAFFADLATPLDRGPPLGVPAFDPAPASMARLAASPPLRAPFAYLALPFGGGDRERALDGDDAFDRLQCCGTAARVEQVTVAVWLKVYAYRS